MNRLILFLLLFAAVGCTNEETKVTTSGNNSTLYIEGEVSGTPVRHFEYGHSYIKFGYKQGVVHDPDCPACR